MIIAVKSLYLQNNKKNSHIYILCDSLKVSACVLKY